MDTGSIINLCTVENMSLAELYEDPQFNKIPKDKIFDYISMSGRIAGDKAAKIKTDNENTELMDICRSKGVTVNIVDKDYSIMNVRYRAEIYYDKKIINIMKNSIVQMYDQLKDIQFFEDNFPITVDKIIDIHAAHELYHLMESIDREETPGLLPKVTSIKIGRFEKKAEVVRTSEVAAHIFCMKLLELPFHPKLLDYLYLVSSGEVTEKRLIEFLRDIQKFNESIRNI